MITTFKNLYRKKEYKLILVYLYEMFVLFILISYFTNPLFKILMATLWVIYYREYIDSLRLK